MRQKRNWLYVLTALFCALILFAYAKSGTSQTAGHQNTSEIYTNRIDSVPITLKYDTDKYFVSGSISEVAVQLTGSNRVSLSSEMQEATRSFRVEADLTQAGEGQVDVPLTIKNLPYGLTATVKPQKVSIRIGKKATKDVNVELKIDSDQIKKGIRIEKARIADQEVTVTSDEDTIKRLDHVEASLSQGEIIDGDYNGTVVLRPVDANGNLLAGVVSPYQTTVKLTVKTDSTSSSSSSSKNN